MLFRSVCVAGACSMVCTPGNLDCDRDAEDGCETTPDDDPAHCGLCGAACVFGPESEPVCEDGQCAPLACTPGRGDCDGDRGTGCETDLVANLDHCGACDAPCPLDAPEDVTCEAGRCVFACDPTRADCDGDRDNGCETDLTSDLAHCGQCDTACLPEDEEAGAAAEVCLDGGCTLCGNGVLDPGEAGRPPAGRPRLHRAGPGHLQVGFQQNPPARLPERLLVGSRGGGAMVRATGRQRPVQAADGQSKVGLTGSPNTS